MTKGSSSIEPISENLIPYSSTHARAIWCSSLAIFNRAAGGWLKSSKEAPNCPSVCLCHICLSLCLCCHVPPFACIMPVHLFACIIYVLLFACRMDHTNRPSSVSCYSGRCHVLVPITLLDYSPEFRSLTIVIFRFIDRDSSRSILLSANMMSRKDGLYVVILSIWMPTWRSSYMLRMWASDSATPVWRAMAGGRIPLSWKGPESIWTWVSSCLGTFLAPSWRSLLEKAVRARSEKNFTLSSES